MIKITTLSVTTALLVASSFSLRASVVYSTDFDVSYSGTTGSTSFDGTTIAPESWFGSSNDVGISGGEMSFSNSTQNRFRGSVVWLDTSTWGDAAATVTVEFDVTSFTAGADTAIIFQAYAANDLGDANTVGLDLHGSYGNVGVTSTGTASIAQIGGDQTITSAGNDQTLTFAYNGTDDYIALVFAQNNALSGSAFGAATLDNLSVVIPEPSAYALLAGLTGLAFVMLRRR